MTTITFLVGISILLAIITLVTWGIARVLGIQSKTSRVLMSIAMIAGALLLITLIMTVAASMILTL